MTSCSDEVLFDRLMEENPGGAVHGPWDGNMIQQDVAPDGKLLDVAPVNSSGTSMQ